MPQIIYTFSAKIEDAPLLDMIDAIAAREKKTRSFVIKEALAEYAKQHGEGNSSYKLDSYDEEGMLAYPTAWAPFDEENLSGLTDAEVTEMMERLLARTGQLNGLVRRRYPGIGGYRDFLKFKAGKGVSTGTRR